MSLTTPAETASDLGCLLIDSVTKLQCHISPRRTTDISHRHPLALALHDRRSRRRFRIGVSYRARSWVTTHSPARMRVPRLGLPGAERAPGAAPASLWSTPEAVAQFAAMTRGTPMVRRPLVPQQGAEARKARRAPTGDALAPPHPGVAMPFCTPAAGAIGEAVAASAATAASAAAPTIAAALIRRLEENVGGCMACSLARR